MVKLSLMNDKGFTLIEVLITTAVMAIIGGLMTGIFYTVTSVNQRETASGEVTSQLNFVTQTIQRLIRESSNIEIEAGTSTTTLKLRMADSAKDPTCITVATGTIRLAQGPDATNAENCTSNSTDLTNDKVVVDSLNFKKFTQYPGHDTVSFDIAMSYNSQDPAAQVQRTLQSAIARVSAATFDSNLLPGDTTFTVGQVGSEWQNIIAADGTAADPSYTFGNSLGTGFFRSGTDILGISTAGAERLTIDASGNVGIGTSTPSYALEVAGTFRAGTSTFAGDMSFAGSTSTYRITNVASPSSASDVATKAYVDSSVGTGLPSGTDGQTLRYSGSTILANSLFYNNGTQIGINTATPDSFTMKINGTLGVSTEEFGTAGVINENISNTDVAMATAVDDNYVYYAGYTNSTGGGENTSLRVEKRYKSTGAFVTAFGTNGAVTYNPTAGGDYYYTMAIDSNYIYLAGGYNNMWGSLQIYIEKRDITTGALVTAFDGDGIAVNDVAGGQEIINSIAIDSNYIYLAGMSHDYGNWHIEKRDITTGALVSAFGTNGQIELDITDRDEAYDIEVDANYIYIAGSEGGWPNTPYWRVEKRDKTTGELVTAFDTDGVINVDPNGNSAVAHTIAIDSSYIYIVGTDNTIDTDGNYRIEKRNITTGALISAFGTNGVISYNPAGANYGVVTLRGAAVDSNYLYYSSWVSNGYYYPTYIHKRDITTGALITAFDGDGITENINLSAYSMAMDGEYLYSAGIGSGNFMMEKRYITNGALVTAGNIYLQGGRIGVGRAPSTNPLEVEGAASKTTAGDWLANSDARIKTDIKPITSALDIISQLNPVKFKYTPEYMKEHPSVEDRYYYNYIAQEYQKVFPDEVKMGADGLLQIDGHNIDVYLTQTIKDLIGIVRNRDIELEELDRKIKNLK